MCSLCCMAGSEGQKMQSQHLWLQDSALPSTQYKRADDGGSETFLCHTPRVAHHAVSLKFKFACTVYGQRLLNYEIGVSFLLSSRF